MLNYQAEFTYHASFPVCFTRDVFSHENPTVAEIMGTGAKPALFFCERAVALALPDFAAKAKSYFAARKLQLAAPPQIIDGGEPCKNNLDTVLHTADMIASANLCRHSFVLVCGGGAFLDTIGFAAALAHRGVRLLRLPSTALSQADSGVGVKNGINYHGMKNFLGTFAAPFAVIADLNFIASLPPVLRLDGVAEAFKVAIIEDVEFFGFLEKNAGAFAAGELPPLEEAIMHSARLHSAHIRDNGDPFELGSARPLDFGHWSAHWLETQSHYTIRHGKAVASGIALDSIIARNLGLLEPADCARVIRALQQCGFKLWHDEFADLPALYSGIEAFRQHLGGELCLTMPAGLGRKQEIHALSREEVARALIELPRN